ncbi:hypothetical protein AXG93_2193s1020 [Marchantia polymorpha subsp. ruderalis]|uniref:Uncharacterized protein n=1 Tax=Marchantia polymorpha subsp. ruderalis TaxID=1480154 RepID=A0A176VT52_MARPO|nr:hypothetical protein AXG93_2193s1020 [Marchantia polymorpha subsp. ruderalis]
MEKLNSKGSMYVLLPVVLLSLSSMRWTAENQPRLQKWWLRQRPSRGLARETDATSVEASHPATGTRAADVVLCSARRNLSQIPSFSHVRLSDMTKCQREAKPTGVVFTEDSTKGSWILKSSNAHNLFSQLENLPEGEKVNWLKSNGASFSASTIVTETVAH